MPAQGRHRPEVEHQRDRASIPLLSEKNSLTKLNFFFAKFSLFFLAWACTGRAPSSGEKTYAFSAGGPKKSKKSKKSRKNRIFSNFRNRSKSENLVIWRSVLAEKSTFWRNFHFFFGWGLYWAGSQYWGKDLCIFGRETKNWTIFVR